MRTNTFFVAFNGCEDKVILVREEVMQYPFKPASVGIYRLSYDPQQTLTEQGWSKVYECSSVSGFLK